MSAVWIVVAVVGAGTIAMRALGPVLLGGRALPRVVAGPVELLAPAVLAALVVTQTVGGNRAIEVDERLLGVTASIVALRLRAPLLVVVAVAAVVTALARLA
jgi:branched-subunit amino acid transport protein